MAKEFYDRKRESIIDSFNKNYERTIKQLVQRLGDQAAEDARLETIERIDGLIPRLPDVGGRDNQFIQVILFCAWYMPFYEAVSDRGMDTEEYVRMITRLFHASFTRYPGFVRHLGGRLVRSRFFIRRMEKRAAISQRRRYPKDWVYSVSRDTEDPDTLFQVEYSQCAVCLLMEECGAEELMPYCNVVDFIMAKSLGYGFENPLVIGRGSETCVGIFRKDDRCEIPDYLDFAFEGLEF